MNESWFSSTFQLPKRSSLALRHFHIALSVKQAEVRLLITKWNRWQSWQIRQSKFSRFSHSSGLEMHSNWRLWQTSGGRDDDDAEFEVFSRLKTNFNVTQGCEKIIFSIDLWRVVIMVRSQVGAFSKEKKNLSSRKIWIWIRYNFRVISIQWELMKASYKYF